MSKKTAFLLLFAIALLAAAYWFRTRDMMVLQDITIGAGVIAFLTSIWSQVQVAFGYIRNLIFVSSVVEGDDDLGAVLLRYLLETCPRRYSLGNKTYGNFSAYILSEGRRERVAYLARWRSSNLFIRNKCPIMVLGSAQGNNSGPMTFIYLRGSLDWKEFVRLAIEHEDAHGTERATSSSNRYRVVRLTGSRSDSKSLQSPTNGDSEGKAARAENAGLAAARGGHELLHHSWDDIGTPEPPCALDKLSLNAEQNRAIDEVTFWTRSEPEFKKRGIPWKRGFLFHGPPGTGKTSMTRALAEWLDFPVFFFDLASMTNTEFIKAWTKMLSSTPAIALFEDFDAVFGGMDIDSEGKPFFNPRKNITNTETDKSGVTFDAILNCIDGVEVANGLLTVITTNHFDRIDPALSASNVPEGEMPTRPGRIDRDVKFSSLDQAGREKMAARILDEGQDLAKIVEAGRKDTAAQFQERCFRAWIDRRFEEFKRAEALQQRQRGK